MGYRIQLLTTAARPTAVVRWAITWDEFPTLWMHLLAFLRKGEMRQSGQNVMLYRDDVSNVEFGVEVNRPFVSSGSVVSSTLPAGKTAMTIHHGPHGGLGAALRAVRDWCAANRCEMAGPR